MQTRAFLTLVIAGSTCAAAFAQPKLVALPINHDLSASGNVVSGYLYDSALGKHVPITFTRGVGFTRLPGSAPGGGSILCVSGDGSVLASGMDNVSNWGDLNCFTGYDSTGAVRAAQAPCSYPSIAHRYTAVSGWVNAGSLPRYIDGSTGRWVGGTRCDYTVNSVNDLSANGRYIIGGAYSANATNASGGVGLGLCGDFFAFRYDGQTGAFEKLPTTSRTTRADRVSADGSVVTGYDLSGSSRRLVVWSGGAETVLDDGGYSWAEVAGNGSAVAAGASLNFSWSNFSVYGNALVKWNRSGNTWTAQNLGVPDAWYDASNFPNDCTGLVVRGISNDGNTIVGDAYYGGDPGQLNGVGRPFIWRPSINGGVPMDLSAYLATIDPTNQATEGATFWYTTGLSGDGNTVMVACGDSREFCEYGQTLTTSFAAMISLDGSQVGNEPPRIAVQPADMSTRCPWPHWGEPMNVIAGGSWPLNYQWQREDPSNPGQWINLESACSDLGDGFPGDASWQYEGTSGPQIRINVVNQDQSMDGNYRCVISNLYGSVTSQAASFHFAAPINPSGPFDTMGCPSNPASFSVTPVGGGAEYNWQYCTSPEEDTWIYLGEGLNNLPDGHAITVTGAHAANIQIDPGTLAPDSQHLIRCHIADSCNLLDTNPAVLTVGSPCGLADLGTQGGLPSICGDQQLDNNDFIVFITYFFNGNPLADQGIQAGLPGHDGVFDNNDFIAFINNFFHGCSN